MIKLAQPGESVVTALKAMDDASNIEIGSCCGIDPEHITVLFEKQSYCNIQQKFDMIQNTFLIYLCYAVTPLEIKATDLKIWS